MLEGDTVIMPGDLLWTDFGITYMGLNTDTQHMAYVLKPGETDAPAGLKAGLLAANKVQDALTSLVQGRRDRQRRAGGGAGEGHRRRASTRPSIRTPSAITAMPRARRSACGTTRTRAAEGEYPVMPNTAWSIELNAKAKVPEWGGQVVPFRLEEDAYFDGKTVQYIDGRQTNYLLIPRVRKPTTECPK